MSPAMARLLNRVRGHLPPFNFITLHYAYFICSCLVAAVIFWGTSTPPQSVTFTDALFLTVSAMTEAGLNTVNLSTLNTFQQCILFCMIMLGSSILISSVTVMIRKRAFERCFAKIVEEQRGKRQANRNARGRPFSRSLSRCGQRISAEHDSEAKQQIDDSVAGSRAAQSGGKDQQIGLPSLNSGQPPRSEKEQKVNSMKTPLDDMKIRDNAVESNPCAEAQDSGPHASELRSYGDRAGNDEGEPTSPRLSAVHFAEGVDSARRRHLRVPSVSGVAARPDFSDHPRHLEKQDFPLRYSDLALEKAKNLQNTASYYLTGGFIGRNSQFHSLPPAEREELGGVEYRALKILEIIVPLYYVLFQLLGSLGCAAWVATNAADTTLQNGLNPWWVGAFNAVSAFNNSGLSLLDANMVAFQTSDYLLVTMGLLILAGNTCFPVFLRLIIWTFWRLLPDKDYFRDAKVAARFLLDHPRRCYTTLFPSYHTWFLVGAVISLNCVDWMAFEILNLGNSYIASLPNNSRALDGLFQALAVRSGGFYVVPIATVNIGLQVLYVLMMYISVFPVTMSMRNTNVYEERSLGIYADDPDPPDFFRVSHTNRAGAGSFMDSIRRHLTGSSGRRLYGETGKHSRSYFVRQQLRSQLAHDLWWICLAVLFITIIEGSSFAADPVSYSVFNIIFEVISGYGTVGISVGLPNRAYSFCGGWHVLSKLILCAVMLRGRHRGLPVAIDRAVLLPGEYLARAEEEDARLRQERSLATAERRASVGKGGETGIV